MSSAATAAPWPGEEVPLAQVEQVLERQRRELGGDGGPLLRARVANLVAVADGEGTARWALAAVDALGTRAPSRSILLVPDPPSGPGEAVRAWARVVRHPQARPELAWEVVVVQASISPRYLATVVLPLLLPEVPVFTWWPGAPPGVAGAAAGPEAFEELREASDRLLVDSARFPDPVAGLAWLDRLASEGAALSDATWARLRPWQDLLAAPFSGPPLREAVGRVRRLEVAAVTPSAGLLLAGWVASRLGWRLDAAEGAPPEWSARYLTSQGTCAVQVRVAPGTGPLEEVYLEAATDRGVAGVRVAAAPGNLATTVSAPDHPATTRACGPVPGAADAALAPQLGQFGHDRTFEAALREAARLCGAAGEAALP